MQLVETRAKAPGTRIAVGSSTAVELSWVLLAASRTQLCEEHPVLQALYAEDKTLARRVRSFWDDGVADFGEQLVLADRADVIAAAAADELLAGISSAAAKTSGELRLASEDGPDRAVFLQRLDKLRRSSRLRREYLTLLRDLWDQVDGTWQANGRQLVTLVSERYRRRLAQGANWVDIVVAGSEHLSSLLPDLVDRIAPVGSVMVVPSLFSGQGLLFDLPGGLLVGVRATAPHPGSRAMTERLARRLKALADPTRLAIAHGLVNGPMTVGEIAKSFGLAQPTVSNHLKVLREAGILRGTHRGNSLELELRPEQAGELLDELKALLNRPGGEQRPF
jgi:DNA-binding transcriptional ArsR family regulator